ncbi:MAG TPA: DUF2149 domain-containing protein [Thermoleophilaceae bacterium]|nr:DUF2149 domain-containing protein [Thermoleophilaceae bacterium]
MTPRVNARARTREDRAGDPLDGLVNLFDLGIVLAVAFLLAALTSIDLAPSVLQQNDQERSAGAQVPADSVIAKPGEEANTIQLQPGEEVVGQGEPVGTVYRLDDGRTVIVRPGSAPPVPGEQTPGVGTSGSSSSSPGSATTPDAGTGPDTPTTSPSPDSTPSPDGATGGAGAPSDALTAPQPSTGAE